MNLPFVKLVKPSALNPYKNGQLPQALLAPVLTGGVMFAPVAVQFNRMYEAAKAAGFKLKNVGDYRSFEGQLTMFMDRYVTTDTGTGVTRKYEGKTWWLKKGKAPSAAPDPTGARGSNHGWGLAIDLGYDVNGKLTGMGGACFEWLCANAPKFGFYLQGNDRKSKEFEAWHWQYCLGDASPDGSVQVAPAPAGGVMKFDYPGSPVQIGSKGVATKLVQAVVGAKDDGDFGPATARLVKVWQTARGLKADGVVGSVTWSRMFGD